MSGRNLQAALTHFASADEDLARAAEMAGPLPDRSRPEGFATLVQLILEQQVSVASGAAIWRRLSSAVEPFTPEAVLAHDIESLRALGLSRQKANYCHALAAAVENGSLDFACLERLDDGEAVAHLSSVRGIGRWTAEIYLLFAQGRSDIWPAGDLALRAAVHHLKSLEARPDIAAMDDIAQAWRPYRGVAARVLWRYYALAVRSGPAGS